MVSSPSLNLIIIRLYTRDAECPQSHEHIQNQITPPSPVASLHSPIHTVLQLRDLSDPGCVIHHLELHQDIGNFVILTNDSFTFRT